MKLTNCLFLLIYLIPFLGLAQQKNTASSKIDGSFIKPYTNQWKTTRVDKNGQKTLVYKRWTDYGQVIEMDGVKYFHRVQDLYNATGQITDTWTNLVEHKTLLPKLSHRINPNGGFFHFEFTSNAIKGRKSKTPQGGESTQVAFTLDKPMYDWTLYGMLLVGLPFKANTSHSLPHMNFQTGKEDELKATIKGQEIVKASPGKKVKAWRVETNKGMIFWLTKKAPYVIRLEYTVGEAVLIWEML